MKTILSLLFAAVAIFAQDRPVIVTNANPVGGQHQLSPLSVTTPLGNEKVCAPYFVMIVGYKGSNLSTGVMFKYGESNKAVGVMGMMSSEKFSTMIDGSKKIPTVEMISKDGVIGRDTKVVVRLSKQDYDRSKDCLPKP